MCDVLKILVLTQLALLCRKQLRHHAPTKQAVWDLTTPHIQSVAPSSLILQCDARWRKTQEQANFCCAGSMRLCGARFWCVLLSCQPSDTSVSSSLAPCVSLIQSSDAAAASFWHIGLWYYCLSFPSLICIDISGWYSAGLLNILALLGAQCLQLDALCCAVLFSVICALEKACMLMHHLSLQPTCQVVWPLHDGIGIL